jgi:hypothetical protein
MCVHFIKEHEVSANQIKIKGVWASGNYEERVWDWGGGDTIADIGWTRPQRHVHACLISALHSRFEIRSRQLACPYLFPFPAFLSTFSNPVVCNQHSSAPPPHTDPHSNPTTLTLDEFKITYFSSHFSCPSDVIFFPKTLFYEDSIFSLDHIILSHSSLFLL